MYINFQQNRINRSVITVHTNVFRKNCKLYKFATTNSNVLTRCTRSVRVVFFVTRMRSNNSARINKSDFTTEKIV